MNFVKNLRETTIEYINKLAAQSAQIEVLDHDRADYKQSTYLDKRRDLVKQQEDILNEGRYKILDVVNGYKQDLTVRYCAKGGDITDDAKLFTDNIPLAQGDIEALVDKYTAVDNMTMLRMIFDYASNHDIYIDRAYYTEEMRAGCGCSGRNHERRAHERYDRRICPERFLLLSKYGPACLGG